MRRSLALLVALMCCEFAHAARPAAEDTGGAPPDVGRPIENAWIVQFTGSSLAVPDRQAKLAALLAEHSQRVNQGLERAAGEPDLLRRLEARPGNAVLFEFKTAAPGYAAFIADAQTLAWVRGQPEVLRVERDVVMGIAVSTQSGATWGLDRIDQVDLPLSGNYSYGSDGAGVDVYVIDTGLDAKHEEFSGRVTPGVNFVVSGNGKNSGVDATDTSDPNGHGTHCAGTAVGTTYGVAKAASVIPVRVLDERGSGTISGVIAGVDWAAKRAKETGAKSVANMSLGGKRTDSLDAAVAAAIEGGLPVVAAAGNADANACDYSPARVPKAITVGATERDDARAPYSNWGQCVDLFAPGTGIMSAWSAKRERTKTLDGTSMAAPHVTGVAAVLLGGGTFTPDELAAKIIRMATDRATNLRDDSPDKLLYVAAPAA